METIGQTLKTARENKGLALEQVAAAIKTKTQTILALEADNFGALPAPVYVRGFLKLYADYVGVSAAPLLQAYTDMAGGANVRRHVAAVLKKGPALEDLTVPPRPPLPGARLVGRLTTGLRTVIQAALSGAHTETARTIALTVAAVAAVAVLAGVVLHFIPSHQPTLSTKVRWIAEPPAPYLN